jgi:hypothetical protein
VAIAFDTSINPGGTTSTTWSWSHTCTGANGLLIVGVLGGTTNITKSATYNGVAMTKIGPSRILTDNHYMTLFFLLAPATGANTVVVNSGSSDLIVPYSCSYTGVQAYDTSGSTLPSATQTTLTSSLTTGHNNCWTMIICRAGAGTTSAGTGTTQRQNGSNFLMGDSNAPITPAGSTSMSVNSSPAEHMGSVMISFTPNIPPVVGGGMLTVM